VQLLASQDERRRTAWAEPAAHNAWKKDTLDTTAKTKTKKNLKRQNLVYTEQKLFFLWLDNPSEWT
jgi:hypothetical protein